MNIITQLSKLLSAIAVSFFGSFLFLSTAKLSINTLEFFDESEKFVAAQLMNTGMRLYLDIFAHHGPVTFIISHFYSLIVSQSDFSQIRWFMVGLVLLTSFAIYSSPIFRSLTIRLFAIGFFLWLLSIFWVLQSLHMVLYQNIGALLFVFIFMHSYFPLLCGSTPSRWGLIISGFLAVTMCFTAYSFGLSVVLIILATILMSIQLNGLSFAKDNLRLMGIGATLAFALLLSWLYTFADIKGFFIYHFYFNQEIYSEFIKFNLINSLKNIFIFELDKRAIVVRLIPLVSLVIFSWNLPISTQKNKIISHLSIFLFAMSVIFLSPRGLDNFHGSPFLIANLAIFSTSSSLLLQKLIDSFRNSTFFQTLLILLVVIFLLDKSSYSMSSVLYPEISKIDFSNENHKVYMRPSNGSNLVREVALHDNDFLSLPANAVNYITYGMLPISGNYYYLPWQATYNKKPLEGYKIDICNDISSKRPSIIFFEMLTVWDKYPVSDYEPCIPEIIRSDYTEISDFWFIRSDRLFDSSVSFDNFDLSLILSKFLQTSDPIELNLLTSSLSNNYNLEKIGVMFATSMRRNKGEAELVLTSIDGTQYRQKFSLLDLIDNQYKYFDLQAHNITGGQIYALSGGGVNVWESHDSSENILTCIQYFYSNHKISLTPGCPY